MLTRTAARKAPRFRKTHLCGQLEDRRAAHRLAATILIRASAIQLVGQFDIPYSPALAGCRPTPRRHSIGTSIFQAKRWSWRHL
jgi:hypothetical protein